MKIFKSLRQGKFFQHLFFQTALVVPVAIVTGSLVAFFLWLLDWATATRQSHLWLIFLLPVAGVLIGFLYKQWGKNTAAGNNLIMDEIHQHGGGIPFRMAPLVLFSTVATHLFGGSAGREGTAVQMGGSISELFSKWYKLTAKNRRTLLMCGMAAGFGAVFGTPVTGAIFAMEVLAIGSIKYDALIPCFIASLLADITCAAYGIHHTHYQILFIQNTQHWLPFLSVDIWLLVRVIAAGVAFGLTSYCFSKTAHFIKDVSAKYISRPWLFPVIGALLVIAISYALGTFDYLGLGVTNPNGGISIVSAFTAGVTNPNGGISIVSAFTAGGATHWSWLWKLLLTTITLSTGFKGGEVTPLFFIGATLGNTLAMLSGSPVDLFAGLGFIAVFAGATNTPLACTLMGVELFGSNNVVYYAAACFTAYYFSGHTGIYTSQKVAVRKY